MRRELVILMLAIKNYFKLKIKYPKIRENAFIKTLCYSEGYADAISFFATKKKEMLKNLKNR